MGAVRPARAGSLPPPGRSAPPSAGLEVTASPLPDPVIVNLQGQEDHGGDTNRQRHATVAISPFLDDLGTGNSAASQQPAVRAATGGAAPDAAAADVTPDHVPAAGPVADQTHADRPVSPPSMVSVVRDGLAGGVVVSAMSGVFWAAVAHGTELLPRAAVVAAGVILSGAVSLRRRSSPE